MPTRAKYGRRTKYRRGKRRTGVRRATSMKRKRVSYSRPNKRARLGHIGDSVGKRNAKSNVVLYRDNVTMNSRELYVQDVTALARGTTTINTRFTDLINFLGVRIEYTGRANQTSFAGGGWPTCINFALVANRAKTGETPTEEAFFRENTDVRELNFSNALSGHEMCYSNINSDLYTILWRGRRMVSPSRSINDQAPKQYTHWTKYFKIKRQLDYRSSVDTSCRDKIWFIMWNDSPATATGTEPVTATMKETLVITQFWKDVQM